MLSIYHENRDTVCHFYKIHNLFTIGSLIFSPRFLGTPNFFPSTPGEAEKILSHLKKSCALGPAVGAESPGSTYARGRGLDSRLCAYVLNLARAQFGGPVRLV